MIAARLDNGAIGSGNVTIKIARNPIINSVVLQTTPLSASSPNIVGTTEIKGGDIINAEVIVNINEVAASDIKLSVSNAGISNGTQTAYSAYTPTAVGDGTYKYLIPVVVTSSLARDGAQGVTVTPRNNFNSEGSSVTSASSATVNNSTFPTFTLGGAVTYPANQSALKDSETASVPNDVFDYNSLLFTSPNSDLSITNPTTYEAYKTVTRIGGSYNISTDNFTITATKTSNGMVRSDSLVVNIANTAATFSINGLASNIAVNTGQAVTDNFDLDMNQVLYEIPSLDPNSSQSPQSTLTRTASGTGLYSNDFTITALVTDQKGSFPFIVSGKNLAGKETNIINTNPNYNISGMVEGSGYISDQSPCAGLIYLGGPMINPSTIEMENVSEGGAGPNGGTVYSYKEYIDGQQLGTWCTGNHNNKFTIVTSGAANPFLTASSTGDHLFNLDQTNRQANTSAPGSLIVLSQP